MDRSAPAEMSGDPPTRLRSAVRRIIPSRVRRLRPRLIAMRERRQFRGLTVKETFERIYAEGWWGAEGFDSGEGSEDRLTRDYTDAVAEFIRDHGITSVADLGCGDFRAGKLIAASVEEYTGVDVVPGLVERNRRLYGGLGVRFECLDLIRDDLPDADLGLLRQVLQHLSNSEIAGVLENAARYPYLIVTEHLPVGADVVPNTDKPHGPDIRMPERSGVFLEHPPFSRSLKTLLEVPYAPGQVLRTSLLVSAPGRR